jgi:hypothetical protein
MFCYRYAMIIGMQYVSYIWWNKESKQKLYRYRSSSIVGHRWEVTYCMFPSEIQQYHTPPDIQIDWESKPFDQFAKLVSFLLQFLIYLLMLEILKLFMLQVMQTSSLTLLHLTRPAAIWSTQPDPPICTFKFPAFMTHPLTIANLVRLGVCNEKWSKMAALFLFLTLSSDFVAFLCFIREFVDNRPASSHF